VQLHQPVPPVGPLNIAEALLVQHHAIIALGTCRRGRTVTSTTVNGAAGNADDGRDPLHRARRVRGRRAAHHCPAPGTPNR
jgi:hypothetical protein